MRMLHRLAALFLILSTSSIAQAQAPGVAVPLTRAHAHNDYMHARPLQEALECGFCSVEADIYLVDGQLLVAHDRDKVKPGRTLQSLYLDPLNERARKSGGRIYPKGPEFILLVDIKNEAAPTYAVLRETLKRYGDLVTTFHNDKTERRAVTVVLTGNRPRKLLAAEPFRFAALDGELEDLDSQAPASLIPQISANWPSNFKWRGVGPMPDEDRARLKRIVESAHARGRRVRFWGSPEGRGFWRCLIDAGVDLLNVDDLKGARDFLLSEGRGR